MQGGHSTGGMMMHIPRGVGREVEPSEPLPEEETEKKDIGKLKCGAAQIFGWCAPRKKAVPY